MLGWIFGKVKNNKVHLHNHDRAAGYLEFEKARVRWFLSINYNTLPEEVKAKGQRTFRSITIEGKELEFSDGFADLHTRSYEKILEGDGFRLDDCRQAVEIVYEIRNAKPLALKGDYHPFATKTLALHPFYNKE
jgi:UDP-N-acetyl-2-amino-2-deoxyglucuronate dehydrogenase